MGLAKWTLIFFLLMPALLLGNSYAKVPQISTENHMPSEKIRELREERGYSQEGFAYEVGLDRTYMGSVERGERNIAAINLIRIAKLLKVEVGELFPPTKSLQVD